MPRAHHPALKPQPNWLSRIVRGTQFSRIMRDHTHHASALESLILTWRRFHVVTGQACLRSAGPASTTRVGEEQNGGVRQCSGMSPDEAR